MNSDDGKSRSILDHGDRSDREPTSTSEIASWRHRPWTLVKTVNPTSLSEDNTGPVTYTYVLTNTDPNPAVDPDPLTINTLIDDNGTPGNNADDFYLVQNGVELLGVTLIKTGGDPDNLLEVGETWTYTTSRTVPSQDARSRTLILPLFRQWMMKTRQLATRMMQRLLSRILRR